MNSDLMDSKAAAAFLGIKGKCADQTIERMVRAGKVRALLLTKKQGYRYHRKALEDAVLLGGKK